MPLYATKDCWIHANTTKQLVSSGEGYIAAIIVTADSSSMQYFYLFDNTADSEILLVVTLNNATPIQVIFPQERMPKFETALRAKTSSNCYAFVMYIHTSSA